MFISHVGADSGNLAGWLHRELTLNGLTAFLDHKGGPEAGQPWPPVLEQAASGCQVFIALLSPAFWLRQWPVHELHTALARQQAAAAAVTVIPVYCGWNREQAAAALTAAAGSAAGQLYFQHPETGKVTEGKVWQPAEQHTGRQAADQASLQLQTLNSLQQQLSRLQPPNAPRIYHEHYKLIEIEVVEELVRAAHRVIPRQFFVGPGEA